MLPKLKVGPQGPFPRGSTNVQSAGQYGEALISQYEPAYFEMARSGDLFVLSTTITGVAVPISTTTSPNFVLWNPSGSGVNAILLSYRIAYVSGNTIAGAIAVMMNTNAGENVATGAVFTAFTQNDPGNGIVGDGGRSAMKTTSSGATLSAAGSLYKFTGITLYAGKDTSAAPATETIHDFDGSVIVPPGIAIWFASTAASVALFGQTLVWKESALVLT